MPVSNSEAYDSDFAEAGRRLRRVAVNHRWPRTVRLLGTLRLKLDISRYAPNFEKAQGRVRASVGIVTGGIPDLPLPVAWSGGAEERGSGRSAISAGGAPRRIRLRLAGPREA